MKIILVSLLLTVGSSAQSNDVFVMFGSDVVRPGGALKGNYNTGYGHSFERLNKNPFFDEITASYTFENAGAGFAHSDFGAHTSTLGLMKNLGIPRTRKVTAYTWVQIGDTAFTGYPHVENRLYTAYSVGAIIHIPSKDGRIKRSIWIQETLNKILTIPWYTTASVGYTFSW